MLLSKLPINMTSERIDKLLLPIINNERIHILKMLMRSFLKAIEDKKSSMEGDKYGKEIELCEREITSKLEMLESRET